MLIIGPLLVSRIHSRKTVRQLHEAAQDDRLADLHYRERRRLTLEGLNGGTWQVQRVTRYMQDHIDEPIELQELADLLKLSRFYLCRAFRKATGHTPHQWLLQLRMTRARHLLKDQNLTVTDVAMAVGYHTSSAFTHAFRSFFSVTPREFRQQL